MKHRQEKNLPLTLWSEQASLKIKQRLSEVTANIERVLLNPAYWTQPDQSSGDNKNDHQP
ncbi:hypothetical protein [Gloeothece verrucosa]|uniref:Uncharacterized protein n=1 Tax=Gloeothece verrucosa (strain PCC 7822) TaxID=497965 RepID=E0U5F6_GLOV7|nr:hypothetical protein [Gloeothece verrucosa]ADN13546.1 hypothetical protein Cyan7822_1554 [Gloeothece verrucosa PCC 7822]